MLNKIIMTGSSMLTICLYISMYKFAILAVQYLRHGKIYYFDPHISISVIIVMEIN